MGNSRAFCFGYRKTDGVVKVVGMEVWSARHPRLMSALRVFYYLLIIVALILMYGRGDFSTPPFVYQEF
ncbi:MAG: D-Ala-teichoic acid biosynthesis protein [Verrucomicrobiota bacterium]|jgi:hypothetical protein